MIIVGSADLNKFDEKVDRKRSEKYDQCDWSPEFRLSCPQILFVKERPNYVENDTQTG